jgi:hypothetical protein
MGTKDKPAKFDCYAKAEPDEPMFVLLARDRTASDAVRRWARTRIARGLNETIDEQISEALDCADAMDAWREKNRP